MPANHTTPSSRTEFRGQRYELDLTRLCLSRGAVYLPLSMKASFEAGPVRLVDAEKGEAYSVTFSPPRELTGLSPLFDAYKLQPNDTLIITVHQDGSEIEVVKRPRRKKPPASSAVEVKSEGGQLADRSRVERDRSMPSKAPKRVVKEERRVRLPVGSPPTPVESFTEVTERVTARSTATPSAKVEASDVDSAVDSGKIAAAEQLMEAVAPPRDRSGGLMQAIKTYLRRPGTPAIIKTGDLAEELSTPAAKVGQALEAFSDETDNRLSRVRSDAYMLRTQQHSVQQEPVEPPTVRKEDTAPPKSPIDKRETSPLEGSWHDVWQKSDKAPPEMPAGSASVSEKRVSHEPTVVGSGPAEEPTSGDPLFVIERYLRRPETSAVVRIENIAKQVRLPIPVTRQVMKQLASNPDAGVSPIRQDIYLVKRG
jgi:hypothetical protein